jgi:hypothetical protein
MVAEKLLDEELDLINTDNDEGEPDDITKALVKRIIRYETDHYVVEDPKKEDPIKITDEDIDNNIDFFVSTYKDILDVPYLTMDRYLKATNKTRQTLKYNDLMLYARKEFAKVDLGMGEGKSLFDMDYDNGDLIDLNKINKDEKENKENIIKADGARLLVNYMIKFKYGGLEMSQVDLIIEQLNDDVKKLEGGTDLNKDLNIKDITKAINIIKEIGIVNENERYMDTDWYKYFIETIVYDARAVKIVREIESNPNKAKVIIDKIFGPEMVPAFIQKYKSSVEYGVAPSDDFIASAATLMMYTLAKKIKSNMKSSSSRSLIYRGYIIHYMLDPMTDNELKAMTNLFKDLYDLYLSNTKLASILKKNKFHSIIAASKIS